MGTTEPGTCREALEGEGLVSSDGLVFGTYMHGIFQNPAAANALLSYLSVKKGIPFEPVPTMSVDPYELLADLFEEHVDMDAIMTLVNQ
jgi:adenosylcobyric acid synthase